MNQAVILPADPHLLAQWRFDERRRWESQRDPALQAVSMVLGRYPDRIEIRTPAEAPGITESARAIAAQTDKAAYRAALLEVAGRVSARFAAPAPVPEPATAPAEEDDWLSQLDARLTAAPAVQAGEEEPAEPAASTADETDDGLPDFLSAGWSGEGAESPAGAGEGAEEEDGLEAFYLPPDVLAETAPAAPESGAAAVDSVLALPSEEPAEMGFGDVLPAGGASSDPGGEGPGAEDALSAAPSAGEDEPWVPVTEKVSAEADASAPSAVPVPSLFPPVAAAVPAPASGELDRASAIAQLMELGRALGMDVWGRAVGAGPAAPLEAAGTSPGAAAVRRLAGMDVVWHRDGRFAAVFLAGPSPTLLHGLVQVSDFLAEHPDAGVPFYLVGPAAALDEARREAARPTFARLSVAGACRFIGYPALERGLERVGGFLRYLKPEFVEAMAERLDA